MANTATLALVMPVYNESGAIINVINSWTAEFKKLNIHFEIHAYNDGSKDNTLEILQTLAKENPNLVVHDKKNSGHGPTILKGYRENCDKEWIFQTDSDDELRPESFNLLWDKRNEYDFLIGRRDGRNSPKVRQLVSFISRATVRIFYGKGVYDVNSPYRLMRTDKFKPLFDKIPADTFAPNVIISGWAGLKRLRIFQTDVPHYNRQTGEVSIKKWKLFKAASKSLWQTIKFRF